ncbi:partial Teichoic acids export ATP-binding protein TagH, partial [Gammaproteobacteria bacterium]
DVVGIIGRNGAGKSTLLKILSRITEPTTGSADIFGRIGALLEVGTGFHQELTGRENVYLNGAILGMSRKEIERKFDEIVDFAGVEKFVDTPVKHYSSGMALRLGFAVAAHLEPDILVVDEVLAVGDTEFQKKCLGKMTSVAGDGRTVLFVSHNMAAVRSLCSKGIVLESGRLVFMGGTGDALHLYLDHKSETTTAVDTSRPVAFTNIQINEQTGRTIEMSEPFRVTFDLLLQEEFASYSLFCQIKDAENRMVVQSRVESLYEGFPTSLGLHSLGIDFPALWLRPGSYTLDIKLVASKLGVNARYVSDTELLDVVGDATPSSLQGFLTPKVTWSLKRSANLA